MTVAMFYMLNVSETQKMSVQKMWEMSLVLCEYTINNNKSFILNPLSSLFTKIQKYATISQQLSAQGFLQKKC